MQRYTAKYSRQMTILMNISTTLGQCHEHNPNPTKNTMHCKICCKLNKYNRNNDIIHSSRIYFSVIKHSLEIRLITTRLQDFS